MVKKVTIITVCLNAEKSIEKTIKSILKQDYTNLEYLIIDGESSDNTLEVVGRYLNDSRINCISEKDSGIYNAMNKGVNRASGDYILFLNSGDELLKKDIISSMIKKLEKERADLVCGNWINQYRKTRLRVYYSRYGKMRMLGAALIFHYMANHQTILVKKYFLEKYPFNESYRICADFLWFLQMLNLMLRGYLKIVTIDRFIVSYKMDGLSARNENRETITAECNRAVEQEFCWAKPLFHLLNKNIPVKIRHKYLHIYGE